MARPRREVDTRAAERALARFERAQRRLAEIRKHAERDSLVAAAERRAALRQLYAAGVTHEGIANLCRIDRKTVVRWLAE